MGKMSSGSKQMYGAVFILGIFILGAVVFGDSIKSFFVGTPTTAETIAETSDLTAAQLAAAEATTASSSCDENKESDITSDVYNKANTTLTEEMPANLYFFEVVDGKRSNTADVDTDSQNGVNSVNCPTTYDVAILRSNANGGNNSRITYAELDGNKLDLIEDGAYVRFTTSRATHTLSIDTNEHGTTSGRVWDLDTGAFLNDDGVSSSTTGTFNISPASFESTTNGGLITFNVTRTRNFRFEVKTTDSDKEYLAFGGYIALNQSRTIFDIPTISWDGTVLQDIKSTTLASLDPYCGDTFDSFEYVYEIPVGASMPSSGFSNIGYSVTLKSGQTSEDLTMLLYSRGMYLKFGSTTSLAKGACDDSTSRAAVFTAQRYSLNVDPSTP